MRKFTAIIVIIAAIAAIAAPGASAAGTGMGAGKVSRTDLSVQPGAEPVMIYKLKDVIISS